MRVSSVVRPISYHSASLTFTPLSGSFCGRFSCVYFRVTNGRVSSSRHMPPSKTVVEYAKSGRSACKKCAQTIGKDAVRVGAVVRDPRGFDTPKWHHLHCFPFSSQPASSVDAIGGFSNLKSSDQEAIKKLFGKITSEEGSDGSECEKKPEDPKVAESDDVEETQLEKDPKKRKMSLSSEEAKMDFGLSVSDIKEQYKDAKLAPKWKAFQTIIFLEHDEGLKDSSKIAAFDFDGCLANTSVKRVGADAWSLMYPSIPEKLQTLYNDGYKLVIFTNESNIDCWKNKRQVAVDSKIGRLSNFIELVKVPIQVFIACGIGKSSSGAVDPFRKPKPGMWHIMEKHFNSGLPIDMDQSFYVGDAAGRVNDHSDADIKFAQAVGVKFYVPEEYFEG